ncbi:MAG: hypothetical protein AAF458_17745 [Pseudomonadota bacterium]
MAPSHDFQWREDHPRTRIYQIGFNKAATLSLHVFFLRNGIRSVHWDQGRLSESIHANAAHGRPLFAEYSQCQAFTDMEHLTHAQGPRSATQDLFEAMYAQDPGGLFIFNTRPLDAWLQSRWQQAEYVPRYRTLLGDDDDAILDHWRAEYLSHRRRVLEFFAGSARFLYFDINHHGAAELCAFLARHGFHLDPRHYGHYHRAEQMYDQQTRNLHIDRLRDAALYLYQHENDLKNAAVLMRMASELRPLGAYVFQRAEAWERELSAHAAAAVPDDDRDA